MDNLKYCGFDPGDEFRKQLMNTFGKTTFTEEELTKDFYTELYISCADCFKGKNGINLDQFWSPQLREWLLHGDDCVELFLLTMLEDLPPSIRQVTVLRLTCLNECDR